MIRIEPLTAFEPGVEQLLFPYAAEEFLRSGNEPRRVLAKSEDAKIVYAGDTLLCYVGIVRPFFTEPPILWLLLAKGINRWSSRWFKELSRLLVTLYPHTRTVIECSYRPGRRFAEFCGFRPLGAFVEIEGRRFEYYEVN